MATRAVIARLRQNDPMIYKGVYHHSDGYPIGLGKALWDLYHGYFKKNLGAMLKFLITDHQNGWSTIINCNFDMPARWYELHETYKDGEFLEHGPVYFDRPCDKLNFVDQNTDYDQEWEYIFTKNSTMLICIPQFGSRKIIVEIDLNGIEPEWEQVGNK